MLNYIDALATHGSLDMAPKLLPRKSMPVKSVWDAQPLPKPVTYLAPSLRRLTSLQTWTINRSSRGLNRIRKHIDVLPNSDYGMIEHSLGRSTSNPNNHTVNLSSLSPQLLSDNSNRLVSSFSSLPLHITRCRLVMMSPRFTSQTITSPPHASISPRAVHRHR